MCENKRSHLNVKDRDEHCHLLPTCVGRIGVPLYSPPQTHCDLWV